MWCFLVFLLVTVRATTGQAPGDEDDFCLRDVVNEETLMSSFNYENLVRRGPWTVVNVDDNNDDLSFTSATTVSEMRCCECLIIVLVIFVVVDTFWRIV